MPASSLRAYQVRVHLSSSWTASSPHRRSKRRFDPNVQGKRFWLPSEGRHVRLTLSTKGIKTVDTIGIEAAVARIRARGGKV
ncbi:50S ribosomal protein L28 [Streptomyces sp. NPDC100445]|uniref:50S ribosomal protein L28 n=1 Tax=Streptomyces sp. NPDC100445 TaxID=3366102 RepID=UPI0037F74472